jgi:hypothetical protein
LSEPIQKIEPPVWVRASFGRRYLEIESGCRG